MLKQAFNLLVSNYLKLRYARIRNMQEHAIIYQKNLMQKIAIRGASASYGKRHNTKAIRSYSDFKSALPINTYENLFPHIERMMAGERDVLWPGEVNWFAKSSGTTNAKSKYIPITDEFLTNNLIASSWDATTIMYNQRPDCQTFKGKNVTMCGSLSSLPEFPKAKIGDVSAIMIDRMPSVGKPFLTPEKEVILMKDWEEKIDRMSKTVIHEDVAMFGGVPTWTIVLFERMLALTGKENILEIWPNAKIFLHGGVGFEPYKPIFKKYLPTEDFDFIEVYNASEGCFAIQDQQIDGNGMLLLTNNDIFYEFIPMDELNNFTADPIPLWEVSVDQDYAILISNTTGLWRYMPGDTVKFSSIKPHRLTVSGRTKQFINVFGEEVMVSNTDTALSKTCAKHGCIVLEYTVGPKWIEAGQKGGHEWFIEFEVPPKNVDAFEKDLDAALQSVNSDYEAKRFRSMALDCLSVNCLTKGSFLKWLGEKGKLGAQNKVPRLANDRKYLEELTPYLASKTYQ